MPSRVGRYELVLPIASGGMATVYLARQVGAGGFQREVALKLTHPHLREQPEWSSELIEEAKLASRIRHPNVVQVLDVDDDPEGVFLVMEYVPGDTLAGLMRREMRESSVVPIALAGRLLLDSLAGLHAAHELLDDEGRSSNVVHRDFSPQNLIVGTDGITRLTDFGIAKAVERLGFTRTGTVKGKFGYMSPEQVRDRELDRRSDIWSAGVVAWELFSGRRLFAGSDQAAVVLKVVSERPAPISTVRPDVPERVSDAVLGALVIDPDARWGSAAAFASALGEAFAGAGIVLATREEVASYVGAAAGDVLSERSRAAPPSAKEPAVETTESVSVKGATSPVRRTSRRALAFVVTGFAVTGLIAVMATRDRKLAAPLPISVVEEAPADASTPSVPSPPAVAASTENPNSPAAPSATASAAPRPRKPRVTSPTPANTGSAASSKKPPLRPNPYEGTP